MNRDGTFCRVLLSMHASCLEVLDLVSYLRPRKVYPNVIPMNSSREEVRPFDTTSNHEVFMRTLCLLDVVFIFMMKQYSQYV